MTRTIGIGIIGTGWMGEVHSRSCRAIPEWPTCWPAPSLG